MKLYISSKVREVLVSMDHTIQMKYHRQLDLLQIISNFERKFPFSCLQFSMHMSQEDKLLQVHFTNSKWLFQGYININKNMYTSRKSDQMEDFGSGLQHNDQSLNTKQSNLIGQYQVSKSHII